jgi:hypothetical protein
MASKTQHTKKVRARKHRPNRMNMKNERKRLEKNYEVLARLVESN